MAAGGESGRAVDGISDAGSCTVTGREQNPWWRVDLGQAEPVTEVYIVNGDKLDYFEIRVGRLDQVNTLLQFSIINMQTLKFKMHQ